MAEVLKVNVLEDNSDRLESSEHLFSGDQKIFNHLPESDVMVMVSPAGTLTGVLIAEPDGLKGKKYRDINDFEGEEFEGVSIIILTIGEEVVLNSNTVERELWVVNEGSSDRVNSGKPVIKAGV